VRVANLFLYFLMHVRKFHIFLFWRFNIFSKIVRISTNLCQVRVSASRNQDLRVIFPPFSDFRGHICWF
jgi:hypothetical protein